MDKTKRAAFGLENRIDPQTKEVNVTQVTLALTSEAFEK